MSYSTATPAEVDTAAAKASSAITTLDAMRDGLERTIESRYITGDQRAKAVATLNHYEALADAARPVVSATRAEYRARGGWTRAYIVLGGHVHSSTTCSTCYPTTAFGWLTELSGMDEAEIVKLAGERACTVCYPTAPVEALGRPSQLFHADEVAAQQAREERAAAKVERDAKRIAKAATKDGSVLAVKLGGYRERITTEVTATRLYVDASANAVRYADRLGLSDGDVLALAMIVVSLADKHGVTEDEERARLDAKVTARIKRDAKAVAKWQAAHPEMAAYFTE